MIRSWDILAAETIERRLEFAHLPSGWAAIGFILLTCILLYLVFFWYRREQRAGTSIRARMILGVLRSTAIILLVAIWLEPVLATYIHRQIESSTLVLIDNSASMGLRDQYPIESDSERVQKVLEGTENANPAALTRTELVHTMLTKNQMQLLRKLSANNPVRIYQFGDKLVPLGNVHEDNNNRKEEKESIDEPDRVIQELNLSEPNQPATNIGRAIRHAIESQTNAQIAGIVVLSDGQFNQGEPVEVIARYADAKKIPIYSVGIGDPTTPRNASVTAVEAPPNVFIKDPFKIITHLRAQGLNCQSLNVELLERLRGMDEARVIQTKRTTVDMQGNIDPLVFNHQIGESSEVQLMVRIRPQDAETLTSDNQKEITVRAIENKMRVLLVAGAPSWEYRYLSRFLERDTTIDLSCWLQSADQDAVRDGNTIIDHFPRNREELFPYDCIILLDPKSNDFDPSWTAHVESLIGNYGGGLLYIAGRKYTPQFAHSPNTQELLDLLPVVIDASEADLIINELGHFQTVAWPMTVPPSAISHAVLNLSDQPGENAQIWSQLPGIYWHYPARREKPVATVLLRHSNPRMRNSYGGHVLLASQFYGSGRTAFMGFNTTWRWRRHGDRYFNRFWMQLLRHLVAGKLLSGQKRGLLQIEKDNYAVGETVTIEARLLDSQHLPLKAESIQASLSIDDRQQDTITLKAQPNRPGWYTGRFIPQTTGTYTIQIDLPGNQTTTQPAKLADRIHVGLADLELKSPQLDRDSLQTLASNSAGGKYLDIDQTDQLPSLIPSKRVSLVMTGRPITLWDRWWTLTALIVLLGVEWFARKRLNLL